jgi:hypothetical protein
MARGKWANPLKRLPQPKLIDAPAIGWPTLDEMQERFGSFFFSQGISSIHHSSAVVTQGVNGRWADYTLQVQIVEREDTIAEPKLVKGLIEDWFDSPTESFIMISGQVGVHSLGGYDSTDIESIDVELVLRCFLKGGADGQQR